MPQYILGQKVVAGFMALLFFLNIRWFGEPPNIKAEVYNHNEQIGYVDFYGSLIVNKEKYPMVVKVETEERSVNIYKEEYKDYKEQKNNRERKENIDYKHNENYQERVNIKDDRTPGNINIEIVKPDGHKVKINRDMGNGEIGDFDKECFREILNETKEYLKTMKNKTLGERINGFLGYVNEENKEKSKWRLPWFR